MGVNKGCPNSTSGIAILPLDLSNHAYGYANHSFIDTPPSYRRIDVPIFSWKKGCFSASEGVILLSGLTARQRSKRSWK